MRSSRRLKVFQPASLAGSAGPARIHLLDISASGARGHAADPPAVGERVRLEWSALSLRAVVRWRDGNRFGLAFDAPLTEAQLGYVARAGSARP